MMFNERAVETEQGFVRFLRYAGDTYPPCSGFESGEARVGGGYIPRLRGAVLATGRVRGDPGANGGRERIVNAWR